MHLTDELHAEILAKLLFLAGSRITVM